MNFLNSMNHNWNISLFHYRNHGADYGRVLVGMQVPRQRQESAQDFPRHARLSVLGRERQSGVPIVPRLKMLSIWSLIQNYREVPVDILEDGERLAL